MPVEPVSAQDPGVYVCTVGGTTSLTPPIQSITVDAQNGTGAGDTETGVYTFNGGGTCTKNGGIPYPVTINSAGS
jgi:hypothetical protein